MSPRRSSRARTTQPPPPVPQHTHSSTSSSSSGRAERSTRSHHKLQSPNRTAHPRSESTEDIQDARRGDLPQTRQRKRGLDEDKDVVAKTAIGVNDEEAEEEEVTRCICGEQEYPGMPVIPADSWNRRNSKSGAKDTKDAQSSALVPELAPEDAGGLFIQCDTCKVWQHGGCVGIMDEAMSPEEYFCEQCRPDLHIVAVGANGQKSSRYLPVYEEVSPKTSPSPSNHDPESKTTKDPKSSRQSAMSLSTKRRSTMNSRDAAYDEEEQLRIAIEQSKGQGVDENVNERRKRGRSDSEEPHFSRNNHNIKRQRTASNSPSNPSNANTNTTSHDAESDDGSPSNKENNLGGQQKIRGAAARNHREKEIRDREAEREKARAEAAGRRKGRAERRRGDDSDPSDEYPPSRTTSTKGADGASQTIDPPAAPRPAPDTPPTTQDAPPKTSHRKTGRPSTRRGRLGRNQYTKDRDHRADLINNDHDGSPLRSQSREGVGGRGGDDNTNHAPGGGGGGVVNGTHSGVAGESGKPSKPRYMNPHRTSMNEMKRRVAAILEFISRTQLEMAAGEQTPPNGGTSGAGGTGRGNSALMAGLADGLRPILAMNGDHAEKEKEKDKAGTATAAAAAAAAAAVAVAGLGEREFVELSSTEMMDVLTRNLVLWQKEYGKYGEK